MINTDKQKESSLLLQLVDKINDPELKREYLLKLKEIITNEPSTSTDQPYTSQKIFQKFNNPLSQSLTLQDLQKDIKDIKQELQKFKQKTTKQSIHLEQILLQKHSFSSSSDKEIESNDPIDPEINEETSTKFINLIERITYQKWHINITIVIQDSFKLQTIALIDSSAQMNCIQEGLIPTKFFKKTKQKLSSADDENFSVNSKFQMSTFAFWHRKCHVVSLPYEKDFSERNIPTKVRPIQMTHELMEHCKKEIQELLNKKLYLPALLLSIFDAIQIHYQILSPTEIEKINLTYEFLQRNKI
ncbi:hypothetical protein CFOL_v3_05044 [Cephalotus follicularis]|uniref:Retropepsins domain-containing protein n=1 Tax=Cephalotus follicularis TaxID=3775 RepID=A0A1Q3B0J2_CEPFO|nr:hypothetical protein CFOL_v3_05044 [Cephalotus follicularis]